MNPFELEKLIELDARGFLIKESESTEQFLQRVAETEELYRDFEKELSEHRCVTVFETFKVSADCRIAPELTAEAADITEKLYGFAVTHVPGFYLTSQVGWLWGGCMIGDMKYDFSVFLLRDAFRKKRQFLNYRREELLAHELCHSVRHILDEPRLEEYFAYQTSPSPLRRYLGNCFISDKDAWGFLLPMLLLVPAELLRALWNPAFPSWIFWITAFIYPLYLLLRNHNSRKLAAKARKNLQAAGVEQVEAVLFRCRFEELTEFAEAKAENIMSIAAEKAADSVRWQVIWERFFKRKETEKDN